MRHSLFQKESSSIFQASEKRRKENVSKEKIRFQSTCLNYYVCYVCNKYLFNRVHLIWVIFRSIQPHDYQGIRHTLYALKAISIHNVNDVNQITVLGGQFECLLCHVH